MRARRRERGAAALEMLGVAPLIVFAALVALQFGVAGWTVVSTAEAAKNAARAASLGQDPRAAADGALPGAMDATTVVGGRTDDGYRYSVTVPVPTVLPFSVGSVTRTVDMPDIR
ncbi:pilus assembly protein TadE [Phycicoccus endophyticus]|uniref:Pilus assembly protein TadE n=1 Tax=Phycicoccus endophyticus TaxID=1690220 RepID=A0A7G9R0U2_9MICO|nr:pilus assembly protein TadE [Phycicoccus endophyticus]NHI19508.1 pilus assembly protein TadE [Phycicoccus endophyticus]QNN49217.1 pilus assembly protein TadE [Phycicoccus endophyticus]GGL39730.1 hypothetical protein GCM10012283_22790 [Phycicoccus endophyticus]